MAQYVIRANELKALVEKANFSAEQLNLIHKMMRGCTMLRQGKVITSFLELMLPDNMELRHGEVKQGKYGPYRPVYVAEKGQPFVEPVQDPTGEDSE